MNSLKIKEWGHQSSCGDVDDFFKKIKTAADMEGEKCRQ